MWGTRRLAFAVLLVAASCGRRHFDEITDAQAGDSCVASATPLRAVTECPFACHNPKLAWIGDSYVMCWKQETSADQSQPNKLMCTRLSRDGELLQPPVEFPVAGEPVASSLTWNGSTLLLSYAANPTGDYEIYALRFDAQLVATPPTRITMAAGTSWGTSNAWLGDATAVSYYDYRSDPDPSIYVARLAADGTNLGETRLTSGFRAFGTSISFTGTEILVGWRDIRDGGTWDAYVQRLDTAGVMIGLPIRVTDNTIIVSDTSMTWTGSSLGVAYAKGGSTGTAALYIAVLDPAGVPLAAEVQLTSAPGPVGSLKLLSLAADGFLLGWFDGRSGASQAVFRHLDSTGAAVGPELVIDAPPYFTGTDPNPPAMARSDVDVGAVWPVGSSSDAEIMFTSVCP
jgi:hypothetical protein